MYNYDYELRTWLHNAQRVSPPAALRRAAGGMALIALLAALTLTRSLVTRSVRVAEFASQPSHQPLAAPTHDAHTQT